MAPPKRVLILSNCERGQANCFLATSHALMTLAPEVEIHFASYASIEKNVKATSDFARKVQPNAKPIVFHEIKAISQVEAMASRAEVGLRVLVEAEPKIWNVPKIIRIISRIGTPYSGPQMVENYLEIVRIIQEVNPDISAVDNLFAVALTALRSLDAKFVVISPNTLKEFFAMVQPRGAFFWKYPCIGTAWPCPVPWYLIPLNIFFVCYLIYSFMSEGQMRRASKYLKEQTGADVFSHGELTIKDQGDLKMMVSMHPEFDFPFDFIPPNAVCCGPILRAVEPVDLEMAKWLSRPTVLINLGSLAYTQEPQAVEMAGAIRKLLDEEKRLKGTSDVQVLWKLQQLPEVMSPVMADLKPYSIDKPGDAVYEILGHEMENGRVRISFWLDAEPFAILQSGNVICNVNHGGANSYWEAFVSGVPQVILPLWADTYDFAHRAEMLGIGKWASRSTAPRCTAQEFGSGLIDVIFGPQAENMKSRAKEVAQICAKKGEGREIAARAVLAQL